MVRMARRSLSMNTADAAPRLSASMPTLPVPANRSRNAESRTPVPRMLNNASLTRSITGRVESPGTSFNRRPLAVPPMTRSGTRSAPRFDDFAGGANVGLRRGRHDDAAGGEDEPARVGLLDRVAGLGADLDRRAVMHRVHPSDAAAHRAAIGSASCRERVRQPRGG